MNVSEYLKKGFFMPGIKAGLEGLSDRSQMRTAFDEGIKTRSFD